jgi:hypothetical protein
MFHLSISKFLQKGAKSNLFLGIFENIWESLGIISIHLVSQASDKS